MHRLHDYLDRAEVVSLGRELHGLAVKAVERVRVGPVIEQELNRRVVALFGRDVERGVADLVPGLDRGLELGLGLAKTIRVRVSNLVKV